MYYYLWEIKSIEEYDIIATRGMVCWILFINPKLFKTKPGEWSSSCYIEILPEIALLVLDHPNLKCNNDVKCYIREIDKETLVCKFSDGSVMYFEIIVGLL